METGYFDQLIPMTAPQQGSLPNTPPVGQVAPQMSPQSGGVAELALGPEQLRELRVRHFQAQMDNAHT
eukprot:2034191-Pyramimonas_sp.AAC.1